MIKSKLVSLRPIELSDDIVLQQLINNPLISENVVGWTFPVSLFSQKSWIQSNANNLSYRLVVVDNATNEAIGITGLWDIDWHNQSALSAIKLLPAYKGKGIGTEVVMLTMAWAFYNVGLRRLHSTILDFNGPSLGLYIKKCGWRVEGRQYEAIFRKGEWHDLYSVAILKREFDALSAASEFINTVCPVDTTPNIDINFQDYI
ncbi:GNAT family N-acetyltransferase [Acinetobacter indicus]|uniref:GNAT family N-acetyltransferase n=1 Tax=Acinetobacter indicus TaxID=756892 RepID=UPI001F9C74CF|nr:GNAT family protein [Acinetobacter indicus]MBU3847491.1 GNAT family N-acetyltransferase [Candidatus Acinetobacter avistercoris]MDM1304697.1 GNAT family N-acetyltransferase [Acinetobacter indicus]